MLKKSRVLINLVTGVLACELGFAQQGGGSSGSSPTSATKLPLSGRTGATGGVTTNESTVNAGGTNSVNLINSSVNVQGTYLGSVPSGKATGTVVALSLDTALKQGLQYNLGTVSSAQGIRQAQGQRYEALNGLLPQINARFSEDVQQTNLAALGLKIDFPGVPKIVGPYNYFDLRATLTQTVADLVKLRNLRSSRETLKAAELTAKDARDLVVLAVGGSYLQASAANARVLVAQAQVETAQAVYKQAADRNAAGLNAKIDATRSRVELQTQQQRLRSLQADYDKQKLTLARIIGLPLEQEFTLADQFAFQSLDSLTQQQAMDLAMANRADLQAAQAQVRAAELARKAAEAERYPTAGISTDYGAIGTNPAQSHGTFTFVGFINIPIYQGTRVKADILATDSALQQRKAELEDLRGRVDYDVRNAFIDLRSSADQVDVAKSNVDLAQEALGQARDRFAAGVADTVEVTQAQESVATANNDYINAVYSHNLAKVTIARATGQAEQQVQQYLRGK
jgi:outer membrane protein TolC